MPEDEYEHPAGHVFYTAANVPGRGCDERLFEEVYEGCGAGCGCVEGVGCACLERGGGKPNYDGRFLKLGVSKF